MKNKISFIGIFLASILLTSCSNSQWSWWDSGNVSIDKFISQNDAMDALESSSKNYALATKSNYRYSYNTFYKDYLGKFSTETDSNVTSSISTEIKKFTNNVTYSHSLNDREEAFLNAKSVSSITTDIYLVAQPDMSILKRTLNDYGYGEKVCNDSSIAYGSDEIFKRNLSIGSTLSASDINWTSATFGFSKNNDVVIETMSTTTGTYTVKFNDLQLKTFITNSYTLYRLKPIVVEGEKTEYMMDYSYRKIERWIGSSIFDEPLNEPFLLEKSEAITEYSTTEFGAYDLNHLPSVN